MYFNPVAKLLSGNGQVYFRFPTGVRQVLRVFWKDGYLWRTQSAHLSVIRLFVGGLSPSICPSSVIMTDPDRRTCEVVRPDGHVK